MARLEKILNKKIVRNLFNYYSTRGRDFIDELFTGEKKRKGPVPFFQRLPIKLTLNYAMKKIGLTDDMMESFFSQHHNRQTVLNVLTTIGKYGLKQPFRFDAPLVVVWNYTNLCNLRCRYCYQSAGKSLEDELSFEEKIELINQMVEANVAFLAFSGGEPIMEKRFFDVLKYASQFMHTSIATNGTLLADKRLVDRIAECGARNVFVSLDGASAETHDFIRGEGSFEKTIAGIKNLVANEKLHVGINMVVTRRNLHEVPLVLELARDLGVNSFSHYNFIPTGRGKEDYEDDLTAEEREELLNLLFDWHMKREETGLNIISTSPIYARIIYDRTGGESSGLFHYTTDKAMAIKGIISYAGGCGAGRVYAAVQPNGKVTPCVFMPDVIIGDVREERFVEIWRNSELCKKMVDRDHYNFVCPDYKYVCGGCRARAYAYGDILGADPKCVIYEKITGKEMVGEEREKEAVPA